MPTMPYFLFSLTPPLRISSLRHPWSHNKINGNHKYDKTKQFLFEWDWSTNVTDKKRRHANMENGNYFVGFNDCFNNIHYHAKKCNLQRVAKSCPSWQKRQNIGSISAVSQKNEELEELMIVVGGWWMMVDLIRVLRIWFTDLYVYALPLPPTRCIVKFSRTLIDWKRILHIFWSGLILKSPTLV